MNEIYLDNASTTQLSKEVYKSMHPYLLENFENPSSLYTKGIKNKKTINQCRSRIADIINADSKEIYFCSGGSEANNWAIKGIAFNSNDKKEIITSKIEHHSISNTCEFLAKHGFNIKYVDVDEKGFIDLTHLNELINDNTLMISIMMANNEIGTIQNLKEISKICKSRNIVFHTDAVQAACHIPIDVKELNVDLMSISAHKFHGPKGTGCLYIKNRIEIENLIHGGKQENWKRAGTENVANIVGMAKAMELAYENLNTESERQRKLSQLFVDKINSITKNIKLNGPNIGLNRLPGNINLSFKNSDGSLISYLLGKCGIYVSTGSACNSGTIAPSHVLQAINVPDDYINGSIRISLGKDTTMEDIEIASNELIKIINDNKV